MPKIGGQDSLRVARGEFQFMIFFFQGEQGLANWVLSGEVIRYDPPAVKEYKLFVLYLYL